MSNARLRLLGYALLLAVGLLAPLYIYPVFLMYALCFALFACAFNLLLGYTGLLSFGHAAFFGTAAYITGYAAKVLGISTGLAIVAGTAAAVSGAGSSMAASPDVAFSRFAGSNPEVLAISLMYVASSLTVVWNLPRCGRACQEPSNPKS